MSIKFVKWLCYLIIIMGTSWSSPLVAQVRGQCQIEVKPMIMITEKFNDNIFSSRKNRRSDFLTLITPSVELKSLCEKSQLLIHYSPTAVRYNQYSDQNTVRQDAKVRYQYNFNNRWRFILNERYYKSEETSQLNFTEEEIPQETRDTLEPWVRNQMDGILEYQYGPEEYFRVGYLYEFLENDDPDLEDATEQGIFGMLSYWYDIRNGVELNYRVVRNKYSRESFPPTTGNFTASEYGVRFFHRFNSRAQIDAGTRNSGRDFDTRPDDYYVNEFDLNFEYAISPFFTISLGTGYFMKRGDNTNTEEGLLGYLTLKRKLEHGVWETSLERGWDEGYLEADPRGFTEFWKITSNLDYQFSEYFSGRASLNYRENEISGLKEDSYLGLGLKLTYNFQRWYRISIGYIFTRRDSDEKEDQYTSNGVELSFSANRLFKGNI